MAAKVAGERYESVTGQLFEIGRQLRQPNGYPFDPAELQKFLQRAVEGRFAEGGTLAKPKLVPLLGKRTPVDVAATDPAFDLGTFFKTRPGLHVWNEFDTLVQLPALQTDRAKFRMPKRMSRRLLNAPAADAVIEDKLGRGYQFSELAVALIIAKMIAAQPNGIGGQLLNDGKANLFYLPSCVVCVGWDEGLSVPGWSVLAFRRDGYQWVAGDQAFAGN